MKQKNKKRQYQDRTNATVLRNQTGLYTPVTTHFQPPRYNIWFLTINANICLSNALIKNNQASLNMKQIG
jgi:hypothetical protein